jgi:beta-glucanase (GH16 family)
VKPVKADGLISAFFLYRIDPWQEIDIEFLGNDTSKMLVNVYFNPGEEGTVQNHGTSGTPVSVELGFDASTDFHHYAIEWDPNEIRWFVDDDLVHVRNTGSPTPIPNLPLKVYTNMWVPGNSKLAGEINYSTLPKTTDIKSVVLSKWIQPEDISVSKEKRDGGI